MTKDDALELFYANNRINPQAIHPRDRIADLPHKLDDWLLHIDPDDHSVFLEAFSRYTYLTQEACQNRFVQLIELLKIQLQKYAIELSEVLYVTVESSSGTKSGGDNVRADMEKYNFKDIDKDQIIATQSKFTKDQLAGIKAVVFVDDIIGTGKTIWSDFYAFCKKFNLDGYDFPKLHYMCLSPSVKAIKHLNKNFAKYKYNVTAIYKNEWVSKKAFDGNSPEYKTINKYETEIDNFFTGAERSYRMGFEQSCLLISFYYNTPNNTISTFWRPTDVNKPPFERKGKECRRPTVLDLTKKKKQADANSYAFAADRSK